MEVGGRTEDTTDGTTVVAPPALVTPRATKLGVVSATSLLREGRGVRSWGIVADSGSTFAFLGCLDSSSLVAPFVSASEVEGKTVDSMPSLKSVPSGLGAEIGK